MQHTLPFGCHLVGYDEVMCSNCSLKAISFALDYVVINFYSYFSIAGLTT